MRAVVVQFIPDRPLGTPDRSAQLNDPSHPNLRFLEFSLAEEGNTSFRPSFDQVRKVLQQMKEELR
jgi:hypothetical protein